MKPDASSSKFSNDLIVRVPTLVDAPSMAEVHIRSWQTSYRGIISHEYLMNLDFEKRLASHKQIIGQQKRTRLVVEQLSTKKIIGFSHAGENRDFKAKIDSELYAIYLLEEFKGMGIGRMLFDKTLKDLSQRGFKTMGLWVLEQNHRARKFYENRGGKLHTEQKNLEIAGQTLLEVSYVWESLI